MAQPYTTIPITEFISHTRGKSPKEFARQNHFKIDILNAPHRPAEESRILSMMAQTVTFPDVALNIGNTLSVNNKPEFAIASGANWQNIDITFLVRSGFEERKYFEDWINFIYDRTDGTVKYFSEYAIADIDITYLRNIGDMKDAPTDYKLQLDNVYPTSVGDISLDATSTDTISTLSVNFHYTDFKRI